MISRKKRNRIMRIIIDDRFKNNYPKTSLYHICGQTNMKHDEVLQIVFVLYSQGYLEYEEPSLTNQDFAILTVKGISYFENNFDKNIDSVKKGVLLPIITTVITSLLLYLSQSWLLPKLELLLSFLGL